MNRSSTRFRDLPVFYKLLVPFLALMLVTGAVGALLIVHDQSTRAQTGIDDALSRRAIDTRSLMHDRELYLVESVSFAANLQGMAAAVARRDSREVTQLLRSVAALKQDLSMLAVVDSRARVVASLERPGLGVRSQVFDPALVAAALATAQGRATALTRVDGRVVLAVASAVCGDSPCRPRAVAVAALDASRLADEIAPAASARAGSTVTLFDVAGDPVAASGPTRLGPTTITGEVRRTQRTNVGTVATLFAPLTVQGQRVGALAVSIPTGSVFASVRSGALRLAAILFLAMVGVLAVGAYLSRSILRQVRPLVDTNRRLGSGDLTARAPVLGHDELGELAAGVNDMAARLESSYALLEQRVAERTAEVEELLRERTDFFTAISHDFRTPLAVVLSQADMLLDPDIPKDAALSRDAGRTVKEAANQLLARINDILELARAASGGLDVHIQPVALDRVVAALVDTARTLETATGVSASFDIRRGLFVAADEARLEQVLVNVLDNAFKYTPTGGEIRLAARAEGDRVVISVTDNGCGIPAEVGARVFEPFFRVKGTAPQRSAASSGLGLALAKRFVEAQGGEIHWEPHAGGGTSFVVTLPRVQPPPRQRQARSRRQATHG